MKQICTLLLTATSAALIAQSTPQIPNSGFESWEGSGASEEPVGFNSNKTGKGYAPSGPQTCFKDNTTFHSGSFSARIETAYFIIATVNGSLTSGIVCAPSTNKSEGYIGTMENNITSDIRRIPLAARPDSLTGWYKYTQSTQTSGTGGANEIGKVRAILHTGNYYDPETPVGSNHPDSSVNKVGDALFLTPASDVSSWTRFSVAFNYADSRIPEYILINCTSSNNQNTSVSGSKLWLDDLSLVYNPSSVSENAHPAQNINVFCVERNLFVDLSQAGTENGILSVYDLSGKLMLQSPVNAGSRTMVNVSSLSAGMYLYQVSGRDFRKNGKFSIH